MDQADIVEELFGDNGRVQCKRPLPRLNGVYGPCIAEVRAGPVTLRLLVFTSQNGLDAATVRKVASYKISEGADAAIILVKGEVDPAIQELAQVLGVRIAAPKAELEKEAIVERDYTIESRVAPEQAERIFRTKILQSLRGILGGVFTGRRVEYAGMAHSHVWVRCYKTTLHAADVAPEAIEAVELTVCFEMASGSMVEYDRGRGLVVGDVLVRLGELDDEVIEVIRYLSTASPARIAEVAEHLGSHERARVVIDLLAEFGLVEVEPDETVRLTAPLPSEYTPPTRILEEPGVTIIQGKPDCELVIGTPEVADRVDTIVSALGTIEEITNLYYPIYIGVFQKYKDSKRIDVATILDGITGERREDLEEIIAGSPAIYKFDNIIEKVIRGERIECTRIVR